MYCSIQRTCDLHLGGLVDATEQACHEALQLGFTVRSNSYQLVWPAAFIDRLTPSCDDGTIGYYWHKLNSIVVGRFPFT